MPTLMYGLDVSEQWLGANSRMALPVSLATGWPQRAALDSKWPRFEISLVGELLLHPRARTHRSARCYCHLSICVRRTLTVVFGPHTGHQNFPIESRKSAFTGPSPRRNHPAQPTTRKAPDARWPSPCQTTCRAITNADHSLPTHQKAPQSAKQPGCQAKTPDTQRRKVIVCY